MNWDHIGEYNRDQWNSFKAIEKTCRGLPEAALAKLKQSLASYLHFRKHLDSYQRQYFGSFCRTTCFDSKLSACCGFESIYTFFADQVITFLLATPEEHGALLRRLAQPNQTERCVYLGERGCAWKVSPISCAMFFCEQAKETVFSEHHPAQAIWDELQRQEKAYTYPNQPVLFDAIESTFIALGVDSPTMYFHKSPGLLRVKAQSGLGRAVSSSPSLGGLQNTNLPQRTQRSQRSRWPQPKELTAESAEVAEKTIS